MLQKNFNWSLALIPLLRREIPYSLLHLLSCRNPYWNAAESQNLLDLVGIGIKDLS